METFTEFVPMSERWGALFSGHEVNPLWWGLYNWARESDTYRPRLGEVSRGIRDNNVMCRSLRRI